jgi:hypothetical protein
MPFRWIAFTRVSMQRIGVLLAVVGAASEARAQTLEGMSRAYSTLLRRRVPVPAERKEQFATYLRSQRLWERYGKGASDRAPDRAEIQDLWLADTSGPSSTGAITDIVTHEPPQLATATRLLRSNNYTVTDRGRALAIVAERELRALRHGELDPNPFVPNDGAKAVLLYSLLDADIEVMQALYRRVLDSKSEFSRVSVSECLGDVTADLIGEWGRRVRSGDDRKAVARLKDLQVLVSRPRGTGEEWGGGRPPDQTSTVRIEPYVDLCLIDKPKRHRYDYRLTSRQRAFFDQLVGSPPEEFLERKLFKAYVAATSSASPERASDDEIWERIQGAYSTLRSSLGYASLVEVVVLAIAGLLAEGRGGYFEVGDGADVIRAQHDENPRGVRFGAKRGGGLTYVKLAEGRGGRDDD